MPEAVSREQVITAVREFLHDDAKSVAEDANLFAGGHLDSLQIVSLVAFLEERYQCSLEYEELTEENLSTLGRIADLVTRKKAL